MGKLFKRNFCFIFALMFLFVSCSVYVFAKDEEKQQDKDIQYCEISFTEALEQFKNYYGEKVSLDGFVDGAVFDGCYGNYLDESSKCVYDALISCIEKTKDGKSEITKDKRKGEDVIKITGKTYSELTEEKWASLFYGIMAFDYDYPEVFWIDFNATKFSLSGTSSGEAWVKLKLNSDAGYENYYCDGYTSADDINADIQKIENVYKEISDAVKNENVYNKIKYFNSYLVDRNEYNRFVSSEGNNDQLDQRLWKCVSALIYGNTDKTNTLNPVCEGYSRAFKILCNKENIDCVLVSGMNHMWNYVKMNDEKWYAIDVTWDDPVFSWEPTEADIELNKYRYFLQGSKSFDSTHTAEGDGVMYNEIQGLVYPVLAEDDYVYDPSVFETTTEESSSESTTEEDTSESLTEESSTEDTSESSTEDTSESLTEESSSESTTEEALILVLGDVDGNGTVEVNDAVVLLDALLKETLTEYQIKVGNLDKNNLEITAADASYVLQMALGNIQL